MSQQKQDSTSSSTAGGCSTMSVQDLKNMFDNKFKSNKALVLKLHSILTWEQDIYPIAVVAFVTISFLIIHLLNSSVLTTLSYLGIVTALIDLGMPTIAKTICGSTTGSPTKGGNNNDKDQQRFDKICLDLAKVYGSMRSFCDSCCSMKSKQPKVYYSSLLGFLLISAYIGGKFNNLFLTYVVTLFVVLYPGLDKKGMPQKAMKFVNDKLGRKVSTK